MGKNAEITNGYFEFLERNGEKLEKILSKPFPAKLSYWLHRAAEKIGMLSRTYSKTKMQIVERYAELDENGNIKKTRDGNVLAWRDQEGFIKEYQELLEMKVDLGIKPIEVDLDQLEERGVIITPAEWTLLPFLKVKGEKE